LELCCVGLSVKLDSPKGHEKYAMDEYVQKFINPDFKLKEDQAYQDIILLLAMPLKKEGTR
jgi:hypothetical protein